MRTFQRTVRSRLATSWRPHQGVVGVSRAILTEDHDGTTTTNHSNDESRKRDLAQRRTSSCVCGERQEYIRPRHHNDRGTGSGVVRSSCRHRLSDVDSNARAFAPAHRRVCPVGQQVRRRLMDCGWQPDRVLPRDRVVLRQGRILLPVPYLVPRRQGVGVQHTDPDVGADCSAHSWLRADPGEMRRLEL